MTQFLKRQEVEKLLREAPPEADKNKIIQKLVQNGFVLEGLNDSQAQSPQAPSPSSASPERSLFQKTGDVAGAVLDTGVGVGKSFLSTPRKAAEFGSAVGGVVAKSRFGQFVQNHVTKPLLDAFLPDKNAQTRLAAGLGASREILNKGSEANSFTDPTNKAQTVGSTIGDVGQIFTPAGEAEAAAKVGKLAAKFGLGEKAVKAIIGAGNLSFQSLRQGLLAGIQTGDVKEAEKASAVNFVFGPVLEGLSKVALPWVSEALQKSSFRMTPTQKLNLGSHLDDIVHLINDEGIVGSPEARVQKATTKINEAEDKVQNFLQKDAADRTVNREAVLNRIEDIKSKYANDRDFDAINKQVDSIKDQIIRQYPNQPFDGSRNALNHIRDLNEIPVGDLYDFKRSTGRGAFNKAGDKVVDSVEFDIENAIYDEIAKATEDLSIDGKSLKDFNQHYSTLLKTKALLETASTRKQAGPILRLLSGFSGLGVGLATGAGALGSPAIALAASGGVEHIAKYKNVLGYLSNQMSRVDLEQFAKLLPVFMRDLPQEIPQGDTSESE